MESGPERVAKHNQSGCGQTRALGDDAYTSQRMVGTRTEFGAQALCLSALQVARDSGVIRPARRRDDDRLPFLKSLAPPHRRENKDRSFP
jgi:hypothetical protein